MRKFISISIILYFLTLVGCATPLAIKEATVAIDQGFKDNMGMMEQYRDFVSQINERHFLWWQYTKRRALLKSALLWATVDTRSNTPNDPSDKELVDIYKMILGDSLIEIINDIRLSDLPDRSGSDGQVVFIKNEPSDQDSLSGTVGGIIMSLPTLINAIDAKVKSDFKSIVGNDLSDFETYKKNVRALKRVNSTIQRYLGIDITIKSEDINDIADAIRKLK